MIDEKDKNKEAIAGLIEKTLGSDKPSVDVLSAAKAEMAKAKNKQKRKPLYWLGGIASAAAVFLAVGVFLLLSANRDVDYSGGLLSVGAEIAKPTEFYWGIALIIVAVLLCAATVVLLIRYKRKK